MRNNLIAAGSGIVGWEVLSHTFGFFIIAPVAAVAGVIAWKSARAS